MPQLNVADTCVGTRALGPGWRSVVWVQGCPLDCAGCVAPDWVPDRPSRLVSPAGLADELLADPAVTGLTLSGGEPMAQAAGLAELVGLARARRELDVVCFTGFTVEVLRDRPPGPGVADLLALVDVLVDGPYVARRDDGRGLRGSDNQRVHHLTDRLRGSGYDFAGRPRSVEVRVRDRGALLVGVPTAGVLRRFDEAIDRCAEHLGQGGPR
ncbi:4Fe-4S single cluster domain-containing protein [Actinosynnema sp. NPDC059797]